MMNEYHLVHHGEPIPGPSNGSQLLKCPECNHTSDNVVSLYNHSAHTHYFNILASLFMSDFLLVKGKCSVCKPKGEKLKSVNAYNKHMGGKHRLINKFMTPEVLQEYLKLPTTQAQYDDLQALLDMADQPERPVAKKGKKDKLSKHQSPIVNFSALVPPPPSYMEHPLNFSLPPAQQQQLQQQQQQQQSAFTMTHFLAMAGQQPQMQQYLEQSQDFQNPEKRLTKKGRVRKTIPHDPYKCPECDNFFDHVSTLYTHSAGKHYYNQLVEHFKNNFMRSNGMCEGCPSRPINDVQSYVLHVGGKHKLIHQLMTPEMLREYEKLPAKKTNSGYTTVKNASLVNCVICGINAKRKFGNITEYKQHLAVFHFRNQISAAYLSHYPTGSTELTCALCDSQPGPSSRSFKSFYALVVHLGSKHNCILDFADDALRSQLHLFNVFKN